MLCILRGMLEYLSDRETGKRFLPQQRLTEERLTLRPDRATGKRSLPQQRLTERQTLRRTIP